jgi:peptidoglycan/LPS O-acetylase OafA/YrhL
MSNSHWPNRLYALDVSRGFAALGLILWHWQHFAYIENELPPDFDSNSQPLYAVLKIFYERGAMCIEYFFLLSGFIFYWLYASTIENKDTNFWSFWVQRFSRLYPLHLVTLLIVALLQSMYISNNGYSFVYLFNNAYHFILNLGFASNWGLESGWSFNGPVWSVSIEILLYFVFFILAYYGLSHSMICLAISVIAFAISLTSEHYIFKGLSLFF